MIISLKWGIYFVLGVAGNPSDAGFSHQLSSARIDNRTLYWGTYRPNLFFGTRARVPNSALTGLIWDGHAKPSQWKSFRHDCEQTDDFSKYGYVKHDGRLFGVQEVHDTRFNLLLRTEFVKVPSQADGGDWAVRISGKPLDPGQPIVTGIYYYIGLDNEGTLNRVEPEDKDPSADLEVKGYSSTHGHFRVRVLQGAKNERLNSGDIQIDSDPDEMDVSQPSSLSARFDAEDIWRVLSLLVPALERVGGQRVQLHEQAIRNNEERFLNPGFVFGLGRKEEEDANLYIVQNIYNGEFEQMFGSADVVYEMEGSTSQLGREAISELIAKRSETFKAKFERVFNLGRNGFSESEIEFAEAALSNLLGGVGYFYGDSIVRKVEKRSPATKETDDDVSVGDFDDDDEEEEVGPPEPAPEFEDDTTSDRVEYAPPTSLFTSVPSRPFFPRGFLWDEGFHLLLISEWDSDLSLEILRSWFELADENGWIAREQILGPEARSKVPPQFQTQHQDYANPPTLFLAIEKFMMDAKSLRLNLDPSGHDLDDALQTQRHLGDPELGQAWLEHIYPLAKRNYNWYRETQFGKMENATEVYRWRGRTLYHCLPSGLDDYPRPTMGDNELHVDLISWMGFMTRVLRDMASSLGNRADYEWLDSVYNDIRKKDAAFCDVGTDPTGTFGHVCHKGYLSILPLALGLLEPDSFQVQAALDLLHDPNELWSPYGIRSLSQADPLYYKEESYWRGPIWINFNYLLLSSLYRNHMDPTLPHAEKATQIYTELRQHVLRNLLKEYQRTGYLWEQYSGIDGTGQRSRLFTGWTSLAVMIMAEKY
ncbi:Processing alpha glucosidase I [Massospora cicadina]|nr:Processing alpha glucosidase I [Massospora cicadina]